MDDKKGLVRVALVAIIGVVIGLLFMGGLSAWHNPDAALATKALDTLGLIGMGVIGYFFGKAS